MKVVCQREKLLAAFQTAAAIAPARSPKPILQNVKLDVSADDAVLLATDLEIGIRIHAGGFEVTAPGSVVLPLARFGPILRESNDDVLRIDSDGKSISVRGVRSEFKLPAENPAEYPVVAEFADEAYHLVSARALRELIRRTVFATDSESSRYALGGVLLEFADKSITGVGTDGRRLAKMEVPASSVGGHQSDGAATTIVPAKALQHIERALTDGDAEVKICARPNEVLVKTERMTIYSRLVEGRFPKWRDVFPQNRESSKIELSVGQLLAAVRQAQIVTNEESKGVDFEFDNGTLTLSGKAADVGQSHVELPISYDGPKVGIMLDPKYVSEFLRVLDSDKSFTFEIKDAESAAVARTDDNYGYVIMPLARD
jgi:DNA polymerase-3 subunit beta